MSAVPRLAIVISHPIQHFCPQYASFAARKEFDIRVFFATTTGSTEYRDANFGLAIRWEGLGLDRFPHEFLATQQLPIDSTLDGPNLAERIAAYAPDAVLTYGYNQRLARRAQAWAQASGVKLLMFSDSELRQRRRLAVRIAKRIWLQRYLRAFDGFLTTGDANEEYYRHYGVPAVKLIRAPYPIDRDRYAGARASAHEDRRRIRSEMSIPDDSTVCTVVGKFVSWKRQRDAIAMLAHPQLQHVVLLLIGSGPDEPSLRDMAERVAPGRVRFAGFVQPAALPGYYAATDVYVHASEREPHSVAVSESVFMGCPVVISDRCGSYGPTDDVQPGRNGLVYSCGDSEALATAVSQLTGSATMREAFGAASAEIGRRNQVLSHGDGLHHALTALGLITA